MQKPPDDFPVLWQSLSETQRNFLLAAYEIDKRLPHSYGLDKVMPPIGWRTVGLMCGVKLNDVDELVRAFADLRLVYILDAKMCEMALICCHHLRALEDARRRRRWNWITLAAAVLAVAVSLVQLSHE